MIEKKSKKRLIIFLALAFGVSWLTALIIFLTGGMENSPLFSIGGAQFSLALVLLSTTYMFGPAIANVFTRLLTKEGKSNLQLRPHFDRGRWLFWAAAWVLPGVLTIAGSAQFFFIFPSYFDSRLTTLLEQLDVVGLGDVNPWSMVTAQALQAILMAPLLNAIPTFGEEFGWRGYLQPKLMPLGGRSAILFTGIIWGIWHWPIIFMGYNYGYDYFGAPILGPLAMVWFTVVLSIFLGWVTIKADSVWPAVIGHGALNGIAPLGIIFIQGNPDTLLGPTPVGLIGGMGFTIAAVVIFLHPNAFKPKEQEPQL